MSPTYESHYVYASYDKLYDFCDDIALKELFNKKFYQCWGGGPIGGFVATQGDTVWYEINKNGLFGDWTIKKIEEYEVDMNTNYNEGTTINLIPVF